MKKLVIVLVILLFIGSVSALSSTMEGSYQPRETIIAQLSQDIISTINPNQVNLLRNGYIDVGFEFGISKIQGTHYFWLIAPQNPGNYTLEIEDVVATVGGTPEVLDFRQNFKVAGQQIAYSIKPAVFSVGSDFQVTVLLYEDFSKTIQTNFPEQRNIILFPGSNNVNYDVDGIFGNQLIDITLGDYIFPAYISRPENVCGDGIISGEEVCDGNNTLGVTCESLNSSYVGGNLSCGAGCLKYNENECELGSNEEVNESIVYVCGEGYLGYCDIKDDCLDFDGFWYDDSCHKYEQGVVCDSNHRELCENPEECIGANGFWYDDICNDNERIIQGVPVFRFLPERMNLTIFLGGQLPSYTFVIKNTGNVPIENLRLEYNKLKFTIFPENNISLGVNESKDFVLGITGEVRGEVQGAVVASVGNVNEYMLVTLRGTQNENEAETNYGGSETGYNCVELNGLVCDSDSTCSSTTVKTLDTNSCCTGTCQTTEKASSGSKAWLGYLIGGIIIVGGLIIFFKYKKTGKGVNPVKNRFKLAEKKLP